MKAPHGPATVIGSARRMWYMLSQWELALGLWGKKCSPLVCWAGTIISRACVFPLLEWRKIKLRNVERHLLSYCCKSISWPLQQLKLVMSLLSLVVQIEWLLLTTETILKHHCLPVPQIHQVHSEYMMFPFPLFSSYYVDFSSLSSPWCRPRLLPTTTSEVHPDGSCPSVVTGFVSLPSCFPSWLSYRYAASRWPETRRDAFVICSHSAIPLPFMDLIFVNCLCHPAHSVETVEWVVKKGSPGSRLSGLGQMS